MSQKTKVIQDAISHQFFFRSSHVHQSVRLVPRTPLQNSNKERSAQKLSELSRGQGSNCLLTVVRCAVKKPFPLSCYQGALSYVKRLHALTYTYAVLRIDTKGQRFTSLTTYGDARSSSKNPLGTVLICRTTCVLTRMQGENAAGAQVLTDRHE